MGCQESKNNHDSICGSKQFEGNLAYNSDHSSKKSSKIDNGGTLSNPQDGEDHFLGSIRAHYLGDSIKYDLNGQDKLTDEELDGRRKKSSKKSFEQVFQIGEFLKLNADEKKKSRAESFNPDEDWEKQQTSGKNGIISKSEFNKEFIRKSYSEDQTKFNTQLKQGPSQILRWSCWKTKLLNEREFEEFFQFQKNNLYEYLICPFISEFEDQTSYDENLYMIRQDTSRTFPEFPYFEKVGKEQLERSLLATSNFFRSSRYCQGMNFIIGMFLLVSGGDESGSFSSFISLAFRKEFLLVGMYESGLPLLKLLELVFDELFREHLPKLFKHFRSQDIANSTWLTKWMMTLYLYSFPLSSCIRIVDYMISSNVFALVKIAVAILKQLESTLMKMDALQVSELFSSRTPDKEQGEIEQHLKGIDFEQAIFEASRIKFTDPQIRQAAEECKLRASREYSELFDKLDSNSQSYNDALQIFTQELNNILFFIEFFAQMGRPNHQIEYVQKIKNKYISSKVPIKR